MKTINKTIRLLKSSKKQWINIRLFIISVVICVITNVLMYKFDVINIDQTIVLTYVLVLEHGITASITSFMIYKDDN